MLKGATSCWLALLCIVGCGREPIAWICPLLDQGDLRISEVRGPQSDADAARGGQWVEIVNTTAVSFPLTGLRLKLRKLNGKKEVDILVRQRAEQIDQEGFYVLGRFAQSDLPAHVDYGYLDDFDASLYSDGILELWACGVLVDRLVYRNLIARGSWSLDAATARWCVDDNADGFGTPQQRNIQCATASTE